MGKYKQWLHHQEVGARLRDEIAAHEAERERVLKLVPTRPTSLPDVSNPLIAALLGQALVTQAADQPAGKTGANGATPPPPAAAETPAKTSAAASAASSVEASAAAVTAVSAASAAAAPSTASKVSEETSREGLATQEDNKTSKGAKAKAASPSGPLKDKPANSPAPAVPEPVSAPAAQPDTIDPLLAQLLAQAESASNDPLEALNLLASQGPNLTRGEAPQSVVSLPTSPFTAPLPAGQSAISALMGEPAKVPEAKPAVTEPISVPVAVGVETVSTNAELTVRTEGTLKAEKGRSDTDELVAARPTEGYTEPRLIVPQWLKSMELGQEPEGERAGESEDAESKQRFSVSLPFENEEDMRLHESVERWWQRWRQQS